MSADTETLKIAETDTETDISADTDTETDNFCSLPKRYVLSTAKLVSCWEQHMK